MGKNDAHALTLLLFDGHIDGIVKCTSSGFWQGIAYKIPRNDLKPDGRLGRLKNNRDKSNKEMSEIIEDLSQIGIYFLLGEDEREGVGGEVVYIGQADKRKNGEGILTRLHEHDADDKKDYWVSDAIVITRTHKEFDLDLKYLENRFCEMARDARQYKVKNGNDPNSGVPIKPMKFSMDTFICGTEEVLRVLECKVLKPKPYRVTSSIVEQNKTSNNNEIHLKGKSGKIEAKCVRKQRDGGKFSFEVNKGSRISLDLNRSCQDKIKSFRYDAIYVDKIVEKVNEDYGILQENVIFDSAYQAACFVTGSNVNGKDFWKTDDGTPLNDL